MSQRRARGRVAAVHDDVLADQPPVVSFKRPGRETRCRRLKSVREANAVDDYASHLDLVYSVNGGAEKS